MLLTEHTTTEHNQIRGIEPGRVFVTDQWYSNSLLVGAHYLKHDWPVVELGDFTAEIAAPLVELGPELIIVGAGRRQQFLAPEIQHIFLQAGIGVECMTLDAAARTFNVLMSEDRRALAALIISAEDSPAD
ncbi:MAG TPA: MTH938/NDUFAF3 family protein [Wenzhouxiangella sp.]|nr:MTH938/NDUFAF3 family protein [Wenzhouxiangella sp.]